MSIHEKIEARLDALEALLNKDEHTRSAEGAIEVLMTIDGVAKFWRILDDGQRDFINAARCAVGDQTSWVTGAKVS